MKITYMAHAATKMLERDIRREEVEGILEAGTLIESYPDDPRGSSYLILGWSKRRPIHVVASEKEQEIVVIIPITVDDCALLSPP